MAKKSELQRLKDKLDKVLSEYIRRKAAGRGGLVQCITCGKYQHWKRMQAGHFLSRKHNYGRYLEENVHPQCVGCNIFLSGNYQAYTLYMIDMYGRDFVDELLAKKFQSHKLTVPELQDMLSEYQHRLSKL